MLLPSEYEVENHFQFHFYSIPFPAAGQRPKSQLIVISEQIRQIALRTSSQNETEPPLGQRDAIRLDCCVSCAPLALLPSIESRV